MKNVKYYLLFLAISWSFNINAQDFQTANSGEWNRTTGNPNSRTWLNNNAPGYSLSNDDTILIKNPHTITSNNDLGSEARSGLTLTVNGHLDIPNRKIELGTGNTININATGIMTTKEIYMGGSEINAQGKFTIKENFFTLEDSDITLTGKATVEKDFITDKKSKFTQNGVLDIKGELKTEEDFELIVNDTLRIGKDFNADKKKLNLHVGPSGVIEIDEGFTVGEDATITIEGLMIIRKKFDLKRRAKIDIEPNGVLIVVDEFNTENNLQLNIKNSSTAFGRLITISENINL